jgi:hypothetical protein
VGKSERKRPLGVYSLKRTIDTKKVIKKYDEGRDCVKRAQYAFYCLLLEKNVWFPPKATRFLSSYAKISFLVRNFPHELVVYVSRGHNEGKSDVW